MNAAQMKAKCLAEVRGFGEVTREGDDESTAGFFDRCADRIAAIPIEADPRDAEIAGLRAEKRALQQQMVWLRIPPGWLLKAAERHCEWPAFKHALNAALNEMDAYAASEPKGEGK